MDKDTLKKGIDIAAEVYAYAKDVYDSIFGKKKKIVEIIKECEENGVVKTYILTTYEDSNGNRTFKKSIISDNPKMD